MRYLLLIFFFAALSQVAISQTRYRLTWAKFGLWAANAGAGAIMGGREAYHADPTVFERKFGAKPLGFFGSRQWERNYHGNSYLNSGGFKNPHKTEIFGNFGRDYWHTSRYVYTATYVGTAFTMGCSKQPLKHKVLDLLIQSCVFSLSASLSYQILRN